MLIYVNNIVIYLHTVNRQYQETIEKIENCISSDRTAYYQKYLGSDREIILEGADFSAETRNIWER